MAYYKLKNPRSGMVSASLWTALGKAYFSVSYSWSSSPYFDGYGFSDLTAAKRYFTANYQSKKHGFETPIWEKQDEPKE